jgi:hypothetical protein
VQRSDAKTLMQVAALMFVGFMATDGWRLSWNSLKNWGWVPQDQKMFVEAKSWATGEFKNCTTLNVDFEEPTLHCDDGVVGKVFEVRFYGQTHSTDTQELTIFRWVCQKNESIDPSITCRDRK